MAQIAKLSASLLLASALPAAALDFGNGFSLTGDVELEYFSIENDTSSFGFADVTLGWRSQGGGPLTFGFDVSHFSLHDLESGAEESVQWFSAVLGTSFGELAVGRPRPLHDTMFETPDLAASKLLGLEALLFSESAVATFALLEGDSIDLYGATFVGSSGNLTYGAGIHQFSDGGFSANIYEVVAKYQFGATEVYGGVEVGDSEFDDLNKVTVGTSYSAEKFKLGAEYTSSDSFGGDGSITKLYGEYVVLTGLTVGAQYQVLSFGGPETNIFGVSGVYSSGSGAFAELGIATLSGGSDSTSLATASIGFKF